MGYPTVNRAAVDGFLKIYNRGGLNLLFDDISRQAMVDFANVVLRSYIDDLRAKAALALKAKQAATPAIPAEELPAPVPPAPEPVKSSITITLTD